jgi:DinB family protein
MEFDLKTAIPILERTPVALDGLLNGLPTDWTSHNEGPGTWTVREIVAHLIHAENDDWIPRTRHVLEWGITKPFAPFDRTFGFEAARRRPLDDLTREFARCRRASLYALEELRLTRADLEQEGLHPEFGRVRLAQHLATWVAHDLTHLSQIVRVMAARYRDAVGPWAAYLRIVQPLAAT